jgi:murein DD-endopeptidase MepM/ murein hydrolase activator NlpD
MPLVLSLLALLLLAAPASAHAGSWRRPVDGEVLRAFHVRANPYAAGQHRGVDLAAPLGAAVRAACSGRVSFAGRVPGGGLTVSTRCGPLIATYQHLAMAAVRRDQSVIAGARLGTVGRSGDPRAPAPHVHLGVREAASGRYVDPLTLFGAGRPGVPPVLAPPPRGRPPHAAGPDRVRAPRPSPGRAPVGAPKLAPGRAPVPAPRFAPGRAPVVAPRLAPARPPVVAPVPPPVIAPGRAPVVAPGRAPVVAPPLGPAAPERAPWLGSGPRATVRLGWPVWVGLGCVALGLPLGGFVHLRRRRRAIAGGARVAPSA